MTERYVCSRLLAGSVLLPRYFFHLYNSIECRDDEGTSLPDIGTARAYAVKQARQLMMSDIAERGEITLSHWIEIENELAEPLVVVMFRDAVAIKP